MKKRVPRYVKLLDLQKAYEEGKELSARIREKARADSANDWAFEKARADAEILEPAHVPTKLARKSKPDHMSLRKHWRCGGHISGSKNPKIREARKRETNERRYRGISNPKSTIKELFHDS